ncbi:MAG: radical SAM protein [Bradymonadia bacterium]
MRSGAHRAPAVLLISPGIIKWTDLDFGLPHLVSLGGYLLEHVPGVRVEILDLGYEGGDHRDLARTLAELGPFVCIGLSCYSSFDYMRVMALGRFIKGLYPEVPLVTGGYHASALPRDCVFEGSPFDAVLQGEGERSLASVVQTLLGGGRIEQPIISRDVIEDLDTLPPYRWDLLDRYWPRAHELGRKFQIYLSRGCVYHCTFCMERAKSGYTWRAFSPERAIEELRRLAARTDLSAWVVNLADPLFGFKRRWRREVLEGILKHRLFPRQYWTLTRSDDLDEEDVQLLARARFSIGIGVESASPRMLGIMQKGNTPERYLGALTRLAQLSRAHGLNWAANIIVGHPGEDHDSMAETHRFLTSLFTTAKETCGWLSIDPFRLYPGAAVHEQLQSWSSTHGARFYHPTWWRSWYDGPFRAEHIDPSATLTFEARVRFMYDHYGPLISEIATRFRGQGRSVDRVFRRSLDEQARLMSAETRDRLLSWGARARRRAHGETAKPTLAAPLGLQVRDPQIRQREQAICRLLEGGVIRTEAVLNALLVTAPEDFMSPAQAQAHLRSRPLHGDEGERWPLGLFAVALALEALGPSTGDRVADATVGSGYMAALLAAMVGPEGEVTGLVGADLRHQVQVRSRLGALAQVSVHTGGPEMLVGQRPFDALWIGTKMPRWPETLTSTLVPEGRAVTLLGPRFRPADLVALTARPGDGGQKMVETHQLGRFDAPVLTGPLGWIRDQPVRSVARPAAR